MRSSKVLSALSMMIISTGLLSASVASASTVTEKTNLPSSGSTTDHTFSSSWKSETNKGHHLSDARTSSATGGSATMAFTSPVLHVYGTKGPDHGIARIQVNGGSQQAVNMYAPTTRYQQLLFSVKSTKVGRNSVRVEVTDQKAPASTGRKVTLDFVSPQVVTTSPTPAPAPAPTPTPTPTTTTPPPGSVAISFVTRQGADLSLAGKPFQFSGANIYWLGLDDNIRTSSGAPTYPTKWRIDHALDAAKASGATVIRSHTLGISVGCQECFSPRKSVYNEAAMDAADYALAGAAKREIKVMIPLTDQWRWYHGGMSEFTDRNGFTSNPDRSRNAANDPAQRAAEARFYSDPATMADFREYTSRLVNRVNRYSGVAWKNDPTIMAWETGNEMWTAPPAWTDSFAKYLKEDLKVKQLVADGSAADGMRVANGAINSAYIDIMGGHFYPIDVQWAVQDAAVARAHSKAYIVGEFDWTNTLLTRQLLDAARTNKFAGTLYWSIIPYDESGRTVTHGDGYSMYFPATTQNMKDAQGLITSAAAFYSNR